MKAGPKISVLVANLLFSSLVFYAIPPRGEAAITPARIVRQFVLSSMPQNCEASVMGDLCSHVISFLGDEEDKAAAAARKCKKSCNWTNRKRDLIEAAHKKAKESCAKGEAPVMCTVPLPSFLYVGLSVKPKESSSQLFT